MFNLTKIRQSLEVAKQEVLRQIENEDIEYMNACEKAIKMAKKSTDTTPNQRRFTRGRSIEKQEANACGLTLIHYRILKALAKAGEDGLSYRGIEAMTGYYSILTAQLRESSKWDRQDNYHSGSLGAMGYVSETMHFIDGRETLMFSITDKGRRVLRNACLAHVNKPETETPDDG